MNYPLFKIISHSTVFSGNAKDAVSSTHFDDKLTREEIALDAAQT